ncbi:hypothetical protein V2W30_32925 [Streptomyces sp. Q6]|uniref:Uncharacterized protein n=1 Tax=Streptomyces citrinus TaxID=3118173 RepID=A0ACD5AKW1_9ACTN
MASWPSVPHRARPSSTNRAVPGQEEPMKILIILVVLAVAAVWFIKSRRG